MTIYHFNTMKGELTMQFEKFIHGGMEYDAIVEMVFGSHLLVADHKFWEDFTIATIEEYVL